LDQAGFRLSRWWTTAASLPEIPERFEDQVSEYRRLFDDAVRIRLRSDVAVGTSLSGGFDSSAVLCEVARIGREGNDRTAADFQRAFTTIFPGSANNEAPAARLAAQYAEVQLVESNFQNIDPLDQIERVLYDFEGFYLTLPTPIWRIYREMRRGGCIVSIDGHGADEAIGAYKTGEFAFFHDAPALSTDPAATWRRLQLFASSPLDPAGVRRAGSLAALHGAWSYHPSLAPARSAARPFNRLVNRLNRRRGVLAPRHFLLKDARLSIDRSQFVSAASFDRLPGREDLLNDELYRMFHCTILPTLLRNYDRLSMAHGVEVRMPFIDWRLVAFSFALPGSAKIGALQTKRIAREALRGAMPEEIRASPVKIGFNAPMEDLMAGRFRDFVEGLIPAHHEILDIPKLRHTIAACAASGAWTQNASRIWRAAHFLWFEKNFHHVQPFSASPQPNGLAGVSPVSD
jgi:asparagine synthase (glutamine-hydrolysing)